MIDWYGLIDLESHAADLGKDDASGANQADRPLSRLSVRTTCPTGLARSASPLAYIDARDPPFLIQHGLADDTVSSKQAQRLHDALRAAGVPSELVLYPNVSHGFARVPGGGPRRCGQPPGARQGHRVARPLFPGRETHGPVRGALALIMAAMVVLPVATAQPAPCSLQRFAADQGELAYRSCGKGPVTVILPGGPGLDAAYMLDVALDVAATGRRAILLEQRGTGASRAARGDGSRLTVAGSIADVEALRRTLGSDRITLIGHSFGGGIAQVYAATHPGHVARLILLNSVGPDMKPLAAPLDSWRGRLNPDELARYDAARARGDRLAAMKIKFLGSFYHRDKGIAFVKALPDSAIHQDVAPLSDDYARHYDVRTIAAGASFPVVILAGAIDWISRP